MQMFINILTEFYRHLEFDLVNLNIKSALNIKTIKPCNISRTHMNQN